jgi:hypothetical protein
MGSPEGDLVKAGAEALTKPAEEFLSKVAGTPGAEVGELLADRVRFRRFRNQLRIVEKAQKMLAEAGIEPGMVPLGVLAPLLDGASWEEDDSMSVRWASLLASAAIEDVSVPPSFPEILRQLRPIEARMLDLIFDRSGGRPPSRISGSRGFSTFTFEHDFGLERGSISRSRSHHGQPSIGWEA